MLDLVLTEDSEVPPSDFDLVVSAEGNRWLVKESERMLSESRKLIEVSRVLKLRTDEIVRQTRREVIRQSF